MKEKKIYVAIAVIVLVIFALWLAKKLTNKSNGGITPTESTPVTETPVITDAPFPLKSGSRGDNVKCLQRFLNAHNDTGILAPLQIDGIFGPKTKNMLSTLYGLSEVSQSFYNNNYIGAYFV
mgnify:CR=1 FL=1